MKHLIGLCLSLFVTTTFAVASCPHALPTTDSNFCASFNTAATCRCTAHGLPRGVCSNLDNLYQRLVAIFGNIENACKFQHDTDTQTCIDDWHCYRNGGHDSKGGLCSSTGKSCNA